MSIDQIKLTDEILDRLADVLLLSVDSSVVDANPAALRLYGYSSDEMANLDLLDLAVQRDGDDPAAHLLKAADRGGWSRGLHRRNDGTVFPVEIFSVPVLVHGERGLLSVVRDVSELRRAEQEARGCREQLQAIIDNTPLIVYAKDPDGRFTLVNRSFESLFGLRGEELIGTTGHKLLPEAIVAAHRENDLAVMEGRSSLTSEEVYEGEHAARTYLSTTFPLFDAEGAVRGISGVSTDISQMKRVEAELTASNSRLQGLIGDVTQAMGRIVAARDPYTMGHEMRVTEFAVALAEQMGLPTDDIAAVRMAAAVHDIGKMAVPAEILSKPGILSAAEFALVRAHPDTGYGILKDIDFPWPIAEPVLQHHERMDGSGYPQGLQGDEICLVARIIAVADVVEAMSSHRPYRPGLGIDAAIAEILEHRDRYDADVVTACLELYESGRIVWQQPAAGVDPTERPAPDSSA